MIRKTPAGVIRMNEMTERERETLRELERVLLTEVPAERFCCDGGEKDKCMCILPGEAGQWIVFFRDGTLGEDVTIHPDLEEAALQLISNVAPSDAALERLRARFPGR